MNIQKKAAYPLEGQIHKEIKGKIPCWADMVLMSLKAATYKSQPVGPDIR